MFSKEMEALIEAALQDGVLTDQEKTVLLKRAQREGIDVDELDIYIQSLLQKRHQDEAEQAAAEDRQSKMGTVKKCPNCENQVQLGWAACPACGFAFNNEKNSSAYTRFYEKTVEMTATITPINIFTGGFLKKVNKKANFIENYPVPNNRSVLLEFLDQLKVSSNINAKEPSKYHGTVQDADRFGLSYWKLYEKCINMAKRSFSNDPDFQEFFTHYEDQIANKKKGFFAKLFG